MLNRLIVITDNSDGYTFFCHNYYPVLFSSKEEFQIIFEEKVLELQRNKIHYNKEIDLLDDKIREIYVFLVKKHTQTKQDNLLVLNNQLQETKNKILKEFQLGGQNWSFEDFINEDKTITIPQVLTLDEWFLQVERNK